MSANPYLIGIAGPSGAGKSYLAHHLADALHAPVLALDRYYRDLSHLPFKQRVRSNFDEPAALEESLLIAQVAELRHGRAIDLPAYDFSLHSRLPMTQRFEPTPYVILEGLFTLYWQELRELLDTRVYVETDDNLCLARRIERDTRERGRSRHSVVWQFQSTVAPMAERYVRPSRQFADLTLAGDTPIADGVARVLDHVRSCPRQADSKTPLPTVRPCLSSSHSGIRGNS